MNAKQAVESHHLVAKIVFASKQAKPDTCTSISFLATRVREPDNKNWSNLVHIEKLHKEPNTYPECQRKWYTKILDLWIIRGAYKYERTHWWWSINGKRIYHCLFNKVEAEHANFYWNWNCISDGCIPSKLWTRYWLNA